MKTQTDQRVRFHHTLGTNDFSGGSLKADPHPALVLESDKMFKRKDLLNYWPCVLGILFSLFCTLLFLVIMGHQVWPTPALLTTLYCLVKDPQNSNMANGPLTKTLETMSENNFSSFRLIISEIIPRPRKVNKLTKRSAFFTLESHSHWIFYSTVSSLMNFDSMIYETSPK